MGTESKMKAHERDMKMFQPEVFDQLTAVGQTPAYTDGWRWGNHTFQIKVVLAGSTSVEVMAQGSHDGTNWFNLDSTGSLVINASETVGYYFSGVSLVQVRLAFVAEVGGTDATIDVSYMGG